LEVGTADRRAGFRGGSFLGAPFSNAGAASTSEFDGGHLAMTYTALAILVILGDDLAGVDRAATLAFVRSMQDPRGPPRDPTPAPLLLLAAGAASLLARSLTARACPSEQATTARAATARRTCASSSARRPVT